MLALPLRRRVRCEFANTREQRKKGKLAPSGARARKVGKKEENEIVCFCQVLKFFIFFLFFSLVCFNLPRQAPPRPPSQPTPPRQQTRQTSPSSSPRAGPQQTTRRGRAARAPRRAGRRRKTPAAKSTLLILFSLLLLLLLLAAQTQRAPREGPRKRCPPRPTTSSSCPCR